MQSREDCCTGYIESTKLWHQMKPLFQLSHTHSPFPASFYFFSSFRSRWEQIKITDDCNLFADLWCHNLPLYHNCSSTTAHHIQSFDTCQTINWWRQQLQVSQQETKADFEKYSFKKKAIEDLIYTVVNYVCYIFIISVTSKKSPNVYKSCPINYFQ